ncbi:MAG: YdcF family protein [Gemmatimonas sp.]
MDLLLRGRGAEVGARAPLWLLRLCGAAIALAIYLLAHLLGITDITGISPFALALPALALGALLAPTRAGSVLWLVLGIEATVISLVAFTPVMRAPAQQFVRRDSGSQPIDAVVVLSASINGEGYLSLVALNRLMSGVDEARKRNARTIALSIIDNESTDFPETSERDQRALMSTIAPDLTVMFVRNVHSTRDEALNFVALGNTHHWQRIAVVTSPLHSRRSCRTFEKAGIAVSCAPAAPREFSISRLGSLSSRLNVFKDTMYESVATMLYSMRGWI